MRADLKLQRYFLCAAVVIGAAAVLRADSPAPIDIPNTVSDSDPRIINDCISEPSETHRLTFEGGSDGMSVIQDVLVQPGDLVKKGDVLMKEDSSQAAADLAVYKSMAEATGDINYAQVTIASEDKVIGMLSKSIHSEREMLEEQLKHDQAAAQLKAANEKIEQAKLQYDRQVVKIDHMSLKSPIDGVVERVSLFSGEAVDQNSMKDGAIYIVNNNPLWVDMHVDALRAEKLKLHEPVEVSFPSEAGQWHQGEVIFLSPELDYVGQTRAVRVSVPNPDNHPSGERLTVRLPASAVAEASDKP
jgi:RND family efflux transporter MFP subunit